MKLGHVKISNALLAAVILIIGLVAYLPWLGSFGPLDPTDSFFLESAREMIETGKYILPLNNYEPWLDKPILFFWLVCGSYKLFGLTPFAGRLPAALSGIATALAIFYGMRGIVPQRTAFLAAIIFLSLPLAAITSHVCLTDATLTLLVTTTTLFLWRGLVKGSKWDLLVGYLACGLGFLCKGPIAPILTGITIVPALLIGTRSIPDSFRRLLAMRPVEGALLALLVSLPWYVAAGMATDGEFLHKFFIEQNFGRMVGTVNHQMPWYFYIPVFFGGLAPWCLLPLFSGGLIRRAFTSQGIDGVKGMFRLSLFWFVAIFAMFTCIKTKLPWYILPACPGFAIMAAIQVEYFARRLNKTAMLFVQSIALLALVVMFFVQGKLHGAFTDIVTTYWPFAVMVCLLLVVGIAVLVAGQLQRSSSIRLASLFTAGAILVGCAVFIPGGLQSMYGHKQAGFNRLVSMTKVDDAHVAILMAEEPTMPYILHKPVLRLMDKESCRSFVSEAEGRRFVLIPKEMLFRLNWFKSASKKVIAKEGKWSLYEFESKQVAQKGLIQ